MIYQIGDDLPFQFAYIARKAGKTGLVVTVKRAYRNGVAIAALTGAAITELGDGLYEYVMAGANVTAAGRYTVIATTADATVDQRDLYAICLVTPWVADVDAPISGAAIPGDAMALTLAERQAVGSEVWEGTDGLAILTDLFSELNAIQTQTDRIGTGDVFVVAPVRENGDVDMVIGDVYSAARNRAMTWTGEAWDIPASSAVVVVVQGVAVFNATRLAANQVRLELTSAQSATLVPGPHTFHIREIPGDGQPITHLTGAWVARTEPAPMPST